MPATIRRDRRLLNEAQRRAIREAMRTLVDEDVERGVDPAGAATCAVCRRSRILPGSVVYDGVRLCNNCATEYELGRAEGGPQSIEEFLARRDGHQTED